MGLFALAGPYLFDAPKAEAAAGINQQINFQGRLLTASGATVPDGNYNIQFKIYKNGDGTVAGNTGGSPAGSLLWTETYLNSNSQGVMVKNGYFSVLLGSLTSLSSVDFNSDTLWLSLNIGGTTTGTPSYDGEMIPMKRFAANPYALNSNALGGYTAAQFLQVGTGNVQADASTNTTLQINKTSSTGNILDLQRGGQDVLLLSNTGAETLQNTTNSTTALNVKNASGASVFDVDTTNGRIGINNNAPAYAIDATGDINASVSLKVNGTTVCTVTGCSVASGSGNYIQNQSSTAQSANYYIQSSSSSAVGAVIKGATSQSADLFQLQDSNGIVVAKLNAAGQLTLGNVTSSGTAYAGKLVISDGTTDNYSLTVQTRTLTANQTVYLPNASGTICLSTGNCPAAGGSGNYIQTQYTTAQPAEFWIQSDIVDGVPAGAATGVIQAATNQTGDLLQFQSTTGNVTSGFNAAGNLYYQSGSYAATLNTTTLTANRTISLPDASGTLLTSGQANGLYIQNQALTAQAANFYVQGASGTVTALIKGESTGVADILDLYNSTNGKAAFFNQGGSLTIGATQIPGTRLSVLSTATGAVDLGLRGYAGQTADLQQNSDVSGNIYSGISATGAIYTNGTANVFAGLTYPSTVTVTQNGTTGSTTYAYRVSALNSQGETIASPEVTITNGNATLSSTNSITVSYSAVAGATSYKVYGRTAGGELYMNTTNADGRTTNYNYTDTGATTPSGALPAGTAFANANVTITGAATNGTQKNLNITSGVGNANLYVNNFGQLITTGSAIINNANDAGGALQLRNSYANTSNSNPTLLLQQTGGQTADLQQNVGIYNTPISGVTANGGYYSYGASNTFANLAVPVATAATSGTAYYYQVTAANNQGTTQTVASTEVGAASGSAISWAPVSGANYYYVYRGTTSGGENVYTGFAASTCSATLCTLSNASAVSMTNSGTPPTTTTGSTFTLQGWYNQTTDVFKIMQGGTGNFILGANGVSGNIGIGADAILNTKLYVTTGNYIGEIINQQGSSDILDLQNNGNNVANFDSNGYLHITRGASTSDAALAVRLAGDANDRLQILAGGALTFGGGTGTQDASLFRLGAGIIGTNNQFFATNGLNVGISTSYGSKLSVQAGSSTTIGEINRGAASQTADLLQFQNNSASILSGINSSGQYYMQSGVYAATINTATLSANRTITLPDASGTVCLDNSVNNCGYATATGSGNYIQNGTVLQTANFNIQSASSTSVAAVVQAAASQSVDILQVKDSSGAVKFGINSGGYPYTPNAFAIGQGVTNQSMLDVYAVSSVNKVLTVRGANSQTADLYENLDVNRNILSAFNASGGFYSNGTSNTLNGLSYPSSIAISTGGTAGSTSYGYRVSASNSQGETLASPEYTIATGNATLSSSNYNTITWNNVPGATSYKVYGRTVGAELYIATVTGTNATTFSYNDTGAITPSGAYQTTGTFTNALLSLNAGSTSGQYLLNANNGSLFIANNGQLRAYNTAVIGNSITPGVNALSVVNSGAGTVAARIQGAGTQTADLIQYQDNSLDVLSGVNANGQFYSNGTGELIGNLSVPIGVTSSTTGSSYYYKVTAFNSQNETIGSSEVSSSAAATTISWNQVSGATGYRIYRGTGAGAETGYAQISNGTTTSLANAQSVSLTNAAVPTSTNGSGLTITTWSGQTVAGTTASPFKIVNSGGSVLAYFNANNNYFYSGGIANVNGVSSSAVATGNGTAITTGQASNVALTLQNTNASATANLFQLNDASGNNLVSFDSNGYIHVNRAVNATDAIFSGRVAGDTYDRVQILANGQINFGSGTGASDTGIGRSASGVLQTSGSLLVNQSNTGFNVLVAQGASGLTGDLFEARIGGTVVAKFNNTGQLGLGLLGGAGYAGQATFSDGTGDGFGATLNTTTLTASRTITLPNASGTICLDSSVNNCGYATTSGSGNYIQNQYASAQTANFYLQSASTGAATATLQAITGQTGYILAINNSAGTTTGGFDLNGAVRSSTGVYIANGSAITAAGATTVKAGINTASTTAVGLAIQGVSGQAVDLVQLQSSTGTALAGFTANGAVYTNGTSNVFSGLTYPTTVTVAPIGTTGSTTYGYRVSALNATGETLASPEITISNGNASLSVTNYNLISWSAVPGATSYKIYGRTAGSELYLYTVAAGSTLAFSDVGGITPSGALPNGANFGSTLTLSGSSTNGSSNALNVLTSSGSQAFYILNTGVVRANSGITVSNQYNGSAASIKILDSNGGSTYNAVGLQIQGTTNQVADLQQNLDVNNTVLSGVNAYGGYYSNGTGETVGNLAVPTLTLNSGSGTTYYYKVTARNNAGETIGSNEISTNGTSGAFSWATVPGATNYRLYRGSSAGGENAYTTFTTNGSGCTSTTCSTSDSATFGGSATPPTSTAGTGLTIQEWAGQTGIPFAIKAADGSNALYVNASNNKLYGQGIVNVYTANNSAVNTNVSGTSITTGVASNIALTLQNTATTPTGDLLDLQNSSGNVLTSFDSTGYLHVNRAANATDGIFTGRVAGDTNDRIQILANGQINFGSGSAAPDTSIARYGVGVLLFTGNNVRVGSNSGSGQFNVTSGSASRVGQTVIGASGQTADLFEALDSNSNVLAKFDYAGNLTAPSITSTGATTVGGAFTQTSSSSINYFAGALGLGTTNPQSGSALTLANDTWISAVDSTGSNYVNLFKVNTNNEIQVGAALNVDGGILLPTDGGQVAIADMNLTSSSAAGTASGYTFAVGNTNVLTVYAQSDGNGSATNQRVAVGTSINPQYTLDVGGDTNTSGAYRINGASLNTAGTLTNVAYLNQSNTFSASQTVVGTVAATALTQNGNAVCDTSNNCNYASGTASGSYIQNGTSQQASANFNISGTGTAGTLQATYFDTASATTLNLGTTNANAITIGTSSVTTTIGGPAQFNSSLQVGSSTGLNIGSTGQIIGGSNSGFKFGASTNGDPLPGRRFGINNPDNLVAFTIQGSTSQTADLQQWLNSSGTTLAKVDANGNFTATSINGTSSIQLNGTNINTAGTLSNVAYLNQTNNFVGDMTVSGNGTFNGTLGVGSNVYATGYVNSNTGIYLNGTSINVAGTLSNVAYLNQANQFSKSQNIIGDSGTALAVNGVSGAAYVASFNNSGGTPVAIVETNGNLDTAGNVNSGANVNASGNLQTSGTARIDANGNLVNINNTLTTNSFTQNLSRSLPTTVGNEVDLGTFALTYGAGSFKASITVANNTFSVAKNYSFNIGYNQTGGTWVTVLPQNDTGNYAGNDFALEVSVSNGNTSFRIRRTAGTYVGTALVVLQHDGVSSDVFTNSTATSAVTAPTSVLSDTVLTQGLGQAVVQGNLSIVPPSGVAASIQGASGQDITDFKTSGGSIITKIDSSGNIVTNASVLAQGGYTSSHTYFLSSVNNTNTSSTANILNAYNVNLTGTANSNAGANTSNGLNLAAVSPQTGNTFNGIYAGTGYSSLFNYNGTSLISGAGLMQNAAFDSTQNYSNLRSVTNLTATGAVSANSFTQNGNTVCDSSNNCNFSTGGGGSYINNSATQQTGATFNIDGNGTIGGVATVGSLTTTGNITTGSVTNNGNETVAGTFGVQGTSTLTGNLTSNGSATFQNTTNSATAFQVQNAAGANGTSTILGVDTTSNSNNMVANGSFEQNTTGWTAKSAGSTIALSQNGSNAIYGNNSLQIASTSPAALDGAKYTGLSFTNGNYYSLSFYIKTTVSNFTYTAGYSNDGSTFSNCTLSSSATATTGGWVRAYCNFTATATTSNGAIYIGQSDTTNHTYYIDGVDLENTSVTNGYMAYRDGRIAVNGVVTSQLILQNASNSTTAFNIANASGQNLFNVDTTFNGVNVSASLFNVSSATTITGATTLSGTNTLSGATTISGVANVNNTLLTSTNNTSAFGVRNSSTLDRTVNVDTTNSNLITNPSIENGVTGYAANQTGAGTPAQSTTYIHSGSNSMSEATTASAVANAGVKYTYTMAANTQYTFSFYARVAAGTANFTTLTAGSLSTGSTLNACTLSNNTVTSYWQRYTCTFTTGASISGSFVWIGQSDAGVAHTYYTDDWQLIAGASAGTYSDGKIQLNGAVTSATTFQNTNDSTQAFQIQNAAGYNVFSVDTATNNNLISNPGFETGYTGWSADGSSSISLTNVKNNTYGGLGALQVTGTAASQGAKTATFTSSLASSTTYTLSFYAKLASGSMTTLKAGIASNGSTETNCTLNSTTVVTGGFTRYSCTFNSGTVSGSPYIFISQTDAVSHTYYLDGVQLVAGSTAQALSIGTIQIRGVINSPAVFQNASDSTTAFQIQNASGNNLFAVDSLNGAVYVANANVTGTLSVTSGSNTGTFSASSLTASRSYTLPDASGTICLSSGNCSASSGSTYYIQNGTTQQASANFNIAAAASTVAATIQGASGQDVIDFKTSSGGNAGSLDQYGNLIVAGNGTFSQAFSGNGGVSLQTYLTNTNTSATAATQAGVSVNLTGTVNSNGNYNTINGLALNNVTAKTGNTFNAIYAGTGYNSVLNYNGVSLINGVGQIQNAAFDSGTNYSNLQKVTNLTASGALASTNSVTVTSTSATALLVQDASNNALLTANTSTGTLTFGTGANTVSFTATGGLVASGTAQHQKSLTFAAEYAGAVLDSTTDNNCQTANNGTMTSGYDNSYRMNYYAWTSTQSTNQCYNIVLTIPIPSDFSSWASNNSIALNDYTTSTSAGAMYFTLADTNGNLDSNFNTFNITPTSTNTWTNIQSSTTAPVGTYAPNGYATLYLRTTAKSNATVRVGTITFTYNSKY